MNTHYNSYFYVLDIETYTELTNGEPTDVYLTFGNISKYIKTGNPVSRKLFRDWETLSEQLNFINSSKKMTVIFAHNLSYEFDFLIKNISLPDRVLSNSNHNVISCVLKKFKNIEFRCSYQLSGLSLKKLGEIVGLPKLEAEYIDIKKGDYIPKYYLEYNYRDSDIVGKYIALELTTYKGFRELPYTKTGKVRALIKNRYIKSDWDLAPKEEIYNFIENAFCGGVSLCNPFFVGVDVTNVRSHDRKSAYPYELLKNAFPTSIEECSIGELPKHFIAEITFFDVYSKYEWGWLSITKNRNDKNFVYFNGKLIQASQFTRTVSDIDFYLILKTYYIRDYRIEKIYKTTGFMMIPDCIKSVILICAKEKTLLKEKLKKDPYNIDLLREYMNAKSNLNAIYGAMVQKLKTPEICIDSLGCWKSSDGKYVGEGVHIKRNFLFGLYTTAYARRALLESCIAVGNNLVYTDTDSIKDVSNEPFNGYGEPIYNMGAGVFGFGEWEYEGTYDKFKTYGAKKYAFVKNGHEELVIAGLPKGDYKYKDFQLNKTFKNCKIGKKYMYSGYSLEINDKEEPFNIKKINSNNGGVALYPTDYTLNMTPSDIYYIKNIYNRGIE